MKNKIKFSIIVPVYNVEKYLKECLTSIINQTYKNYEVIIVNDGSTDKSRKILENYKQFKIIDQKNQGLSVARNIGIKYATGDYFLLLDSDDYLENNALEILNKEIKNEDLIRFQCNEVNEKGELLSSIKEKCFSSLPGIDAFLKIVEYKYVENSWLYCYNTKFFKTNKFKFKENFYHEDFALTPILFIKAQKVKSLNISLYNYRQRENSIMNTKDKEKQQKKCNDLYKIGLENIEIISNTNIKCKKILLSFIANTLIIKGRELDKESRIKYYNKLKQNNIYDLMLKDNMPRKIKYFLAKYLYGIYLRVIK